MGIAQYFQRSRPVSSTSNNRTNLASSLFWPLFAPNCILSALSIANLGLISSMVAFLLDQKHNVHAYRINWPATTFDLNCEPAQMWTDQGHTSNGVAGYGFFLGIFGMIVASRLRKSTRPLKSVTTLMILQLLAMLFTLSAIIFVFIVTYQTTGQNIRVPIAANNQGKPYAEFKWTPETWFKAVLDLPLAEQGQRDQIKSKVANMAAWRWMLIPILISDIIAFGVTTLAWLKQRKGRITRPSSIEK